MFYAVSSDKIRFLLCASTSNQINAAIAINIPRGYPIEVEIAIPPFFIGATNRYVKQIAVINVAGRLIIK